MDRFETVAREAVVEAGVLLRAAAQRSKTVEYKGPVDLVTESDRQIEALITERLRRAFPTHVIVAEEASAQGALHAPPSDQYAWYLDPIDGTVNFAHGLPHFAVSLALGRGADMIFGIVHDPMRDETFVARRGGGATLNGAPIHVSTVDRLDEALLATGFPYDRRSHIDFYVSFLADFIRQARDVRRIGSAALDLCYVACGRVDGFWEWKLKPWDTAAAGLVICEAGGKIGNFRGGAHDLFGEQTLASNGRIHPAMIEALRVRLEDTTK